MKNTFWYYRECINIDKIILENSLGSDFVCEIKKSEILANFLNH